MTLSFWNAGLTVFNLLIFATSLVVTVRYIVTGFRPMRVVFFAFALASFTMSFIYWFAFDILYPSGQMPFAANEISEWAGFIMLGTALEYTFTGTRKNRAIAVIGEILFMAVNVVLWITWSGEWIQDIVTGFALGYMMYCLVRGLFSAKALRRAEWFILAAACALTLGSMVIGNYVFPEQMAVFDWISFAIMGAACLCFGIRAAMWLRMPVEPTGESASKEADGDLNTRSIRKSFCLALLTMFFSTIGMYMSAGICYLVFLFITPASIVFAVLSFRKEVAAE